MAGREPTFEVATGFPGVGKTRKNMEIAKREITKPNNPQKVLIIDGKDEYGPEEEDIRHVGLYAKPIHISQVANFSASKFIECCRIRPFNDRGAPLDLGEIQELLLLVMKLYKNNFLIVEDFKRFAGNGSVKMALIDKLCTLRGSGNDVLVSIQSVGQVSPVMWQNLKYLRMHMSTDTVISYQDRYQEKIDFMSIAENMIKKEFYEGNRYFSLRIDLEQGFIYGKYSQAMFVEAAKKYIFENWNKTGAKKLNYRDELGKKKNDDAKAIQECLYEYTYMYSQFSKRRQPKK